MRKIHCALDIGSCYIKLVVGEFISGRLNVLCALKEKCIGFKYNNITSEDKLVSSINKVLDEAKEVLNFRPNKVILNIPTEYNDFVVSEYQKKLDDQKPINGDDIRQVLRESSTGAIKSSDEILCIIPIMFKVDGNETLDPFGKQGETLGVKSVIVSSEKRKVYDLVNLVQKCGLSVYEIVPNGLTDYYNFKCDRIDDKNIAVVNMGSTATNVSIFSKGIYINNSTLDTGGYDIEREIASKYNLKRSEALYLMETLACCNKDKVSAEEVKKICDTNGEEITINEEELCNLVSKMVDDNLKLIKKNINHLTKKEISYIIITGGLTNLRDINSLININFGSIGKIGTICNIGARDNSYSSALGAIHYLNDKLGMLNKVMTGVSEDEIADLCSKNKQGFLANSVVSKFMGIFFDN